MGTGIMSILLHSAPHKFQGEAVLGTILYFANIPMGLATIVNATVLIAVPRFGQWAANVAWALWWVDLLLTMLSVVGVPLVMFTFQQLSVEHMTAAWLLPIAPAIVCAASGGQVASVLSVSNAQITLLISYVLWGIGMSLAILVMAFYFHRPAIHKLPNAEVIVSAFLPLATCGQGSSGIIQIGKVGKKVFMDTKFAGVPNGGDIILVISTVVGLIVWGLGLWWFVHGITSVLSRMLTARLKFNMGFWGFVFPLGVFVAATTALGHTIPSGFFSILSEVLLVLLSCLYIIVTLYTVFGLLGLFRQEKLLVAPCLSDCSKAW